MKKTKRKTRQVRIPDYQWEELKVEAMKRRLTLSKLLEEILTNR